MEAPKKIIERLGDTRDAWPSVKCLPIIRETGTGLSELLVRFWETSWRRTYGYDIWKNGHTNNPVIEVETGIAVEERCVRVES